MDLSPKTTTTKYAGGCSQHATNEAKALPGSAPKKEGLSMLNLEYYVEVSGANAWPGTEPAPANAHFEDEADAGCCNGGS